MESIKNLVGRAGLLSGATLGLAFMGLVLAGPSNAAVGDDPAGDAITGLGDKVSQYGAAMVAVVVIGVGIMLGIKYLRKAGSKV